MAMKAAEWLIIAGATAGVGYLLLSNRRDERSTSRETNMNGSIIERPHIWPLPQTPDGRKPVISSGHKDENPSRPSHDGADIMYLRLPNDSQEIGDGAGAHKFIMPTNAPVVATEDGLVQICGNTKTGLRIWIDHEPYRTGYFHLKVVYVERGQQVKMGTKIGMVGHNPSAHDALHVHFELSPSNVYKPVNPRMYLRSAQVLHGLTPNLWTATPIG
jgi:murein DD-endopeptidase MepM/ murein hydrolase activator NlpD